MDTISKAGALLLGVALAAGLAGCKKQTEDVTPAPVTAPNTATPVPPPAVTEPAPVVPPASTPAPDTTPPPAGGTTSGTSGTEGRTGAGQPPSTAPDRIDQKDMQRDRRPTY